MGMSSCPRSCRGAGLAGPPLPVLAVGRVLKFTAVLTDVEAVVVQDFEQWIEAGHRGISARAETVTLVDLIDRQPALHVLLRLVVEDVLATIRAEVEFVIAVVRLAVAYLGGIIRLGEKHWYLANLAQHRQRIVVEALTLLLLLTPELEARAVELVEGRGILLRQPF